MTLERVLQAAINSMINGHHAPHCYSAHVVGRGYVNDGSAAFDRADYLRQLEREARSEVENMGYAPAYAETGYTQPAKGVLLANWNRLPRGLDTLLERMGYAIEWSDEWDTCSDCMKVFRTCADSYCWQPRGNYCEACGDSLCNSCHADAHEGTDDQE